ncbi:hypothetical protein HN784_00945 [bacterium]|jgi:hypothetical protein|nr:hypothetical protein [bacterium]MBT4251643.1 hypothetical protein [bacterium]MBT4597692.1 hypothetical protein [bacterium]MBT6753705.1 hypothetical protein [bacterium]MBT7037842.1 hypothetical protein [bacterium]
MKKKPQKSFMLWQKIGLLTLATFVIGYIAILVFPQKGKTISRLSTKEHSLKINLDKSMYKTEEIMEVRIVNISEQLVYFQKPCDDLPEILFYDKENSWTTVKNYSSKMCDLEFAKLAPNEKLKITVRPEVYKLLEGQHTYRFSLRYTQEEVKEEKDLSRKVLSKMPTVYSQKITINNLLGVDQKKECSTDNDCEVRFSQCDCGSHCVKKNKEWKDCAKVCSDDIVQGELVECGCTNGLCSENKPELELNEKESSKVKIFNTTS